MLQKGRLEKIERKYPKISLEKDSYFQFRLKFYKGSHDMPDWMRTELREGLIADGGIEYVKNVDRNRA